MAISEPEWVQHAVFWHIYPLGALDAERERADLGVEIRHRLPALEPWLDHAAELGASAILLGPVFESRTHGYDTTDHFRVDSRLGDNADLVGLVAAAHERGLRVVLDGVFNHVGQDFAMFRQALAEGPGSPAARWFHLHWPDPQDGGGAPTHEDFEGHQALVALNHDEPAVAEYVEEVMTYWLDRGVAGWRLDAAYAVPPSFWRPIIERVRQRHPDAYIVGEVIHGDYPAIVAESGMDSVTQYELWKAIWSSLNDANFWELDHALRRHADFARAFAPYTFVGNHDVTRIASRLADPRHLDHALVVLFTVPGTPSVYAGDEHGFTGVKEEREGGDDAIRPPFPAAPDELSPVGLPVYHRHQELIGLRRRHAWLHSAELTVRHVSDPLIAYVVRAQEQALVVVLSTSDDDTSWQLPDDLPAAGEQAVLAGTGTVVEDGAVVALPPHGWVVLATPSG